MGRNSFCAMPQRGAEGAAPHIVQSQEKRHDAASTLTSGKMRSNVKILLAGDLRGKFTASLLRRLLNRANRFIKPDVLILIGEVADAFLPATAATALVDELRAILTKATMPVLALPGANPPVDRRLQIAPAAPGFLDVNGVRFEPILPVAEEADDGGNIFSRELTRLKTARRHFNGPLVVLQSAPTETETFARAYADAGVTLLLTGSRHGAVDSHTCGKIPILAAAALGAAPFPYSIIEIGEDGEVHTTTENLKLPDGTAFYDYHLHTSLAYCNENMEPAAAVEIACAFGLSRIGFAEHSGHLYCSLPDYWEHNTWYYQGLDFPGRIHRSDQYFNMIAPLRSDFCQVGLEVDVCRDGSLLLDPADASRLDFRLGAVHHLPECRNGASDAEMADEFLRLTERLLAGGVDILAHPLRAIRWSKREMPDGLPVKLALLLKKYHCPAELNFHNNLPPEDFVTACLENGVKFSFGGDAHNLYEIGDFYGQLNMLEKLAPGSRVGDVLAPPPPVKQ